MPDAIDDKIYEIESRVESIIDRAIIDSERRSLIREFGQDLIEKAKQGKLHLDKIKKNYRAFKISRLIHPTNGQKQLTKTLDSYEALSTKIKSISDNLNSFINAVYISDTNIKIQISKFENNPTFSRSISAGNLKQIKKSFPKINGEDLEEITSSQYEKFSPFFSYHRNTTQHAKTSQNLEITKRKIRIPAGTITRDSEQVNIVEGLEGVFENYIDLTKNVITAISTHNIPHISPPKKDLDIKVANRLLMEEYKDIVKRITYTLGVMTMISLPIYAVIQLSKDKDRVESANKVITSMYEAQDNKKIINLTSLITEENTESINKQFSFKIREANTHLQKEQDKYRSNSACYILKVFKGDKQKEYLDLVKLINKTEQSTIDSIQKYAIVEQAIHRMPSKYTPAIVKYVESIHDSLDNLVKKKFELERNLTSKYKYDLEKNKNDPILQDINLAAQLTHLCLQRYLYTLEEDNIRKAFLNPRTVVKLNEDYNGTIKAICDSLDDGFDGLMYSVLVNNTPYLEHLSQKSKNKENVLKFVQDNMVDNARMVASSMASTSSLPYKAYADIIFARLNSQRPLRSVVIPIVYETKD